MDKVKPKFINNEYFLAGESGSKDILIVSFGGIAGAFDGLQPAEFLNTLTRIYPEHDKYFYVDGNQSWYHKGLKNITDNITETVEHLKQVISEYDKVYFLGTSAGGYAAILFGSLLNVDKVLAFKPQTHLRTAECNKFLTESEAIVDERYIDLIDVVNDTTEYLLQTKIRDSRKDSNRTDESDSWNHSPQMCRRLDIKDNIKVGYLETLDLRVLRKSGKLDKVILDFFG